MHGFAQDLRYALRGLRKNPSFTIVAVLTLALGIGANTAIFSVLNTVLLRPLPYHAPEQLAMIWTEIPTQALRQGRSAYGDVEEWKRQSHTFADMAVMDPVRPTLRTETGSEQVRVSRVSSNYFSLLGVEPAYGRTFSEKEADERQRLALISHNFWQARFGGSVEAIGASLVIDGLPSRIIGVLPAVHGFDDTEVWEPQTLFPDWETRRRARGAGSWFVVARLRPGVTMEQAQTEMNAIARRLDEQSPASAQRGISVMPLTQHVTTASTRLALWMLTAAVSFVLIMAIANIAGLSLARSAGRDREIAIRSALGASRVHIVRQLIVESLTLAVLSGMASLFVALAGIRLILSFKPAGLVRIDEVRLDPWGFGWALTLSLLSGVLIGLAPAVTTLRRNLKPAFQEGGRGASGSATTRRIRRVLVVAEFALAIMLLIGAGLLTRSLLNVQNVDPGFSTERVLVLALAGPVSTAQRVSYFERVLDQTKAVAGVEKAAITSEFFIGGNPDQFVTVEGSTRPVPERVRFRRDEITADFFDTVGTPVLRGRTFSAADGANAPKVAIINDMMARRLWPGQDAVGRRFKLGPPAVDNPWFTVVGVVGDMRRQGPEHEPIPQMFESLAQNPSRLVTLLVKTSTDPMRMMATVQAAARQVDKDAPVYGVTTLEDRLNQFNAQRQFQTSLLAAFALVALLLAAVGIYGLIRYSIATRMREISIRIAVGAQRSDIFRMILREGLTLSMVGLALGLVGAAWLGQLLSGLVFGITAADPTTFVAVSALLTVVAAAACYMPARHASRIEPVVALKYE
jgi:putative ABC transport system permease protein